ncbi:hypothetical protein V498_04395 [Pseudogymnoascus sp. VKM F-4517 (FW-2822)]|nr:hypothetical protein V498_04395 [Pseudogymnoascus sp. VKM F-4517 (FW-2822)]
MAQYSAQLYANGYMGRLGLRLIIAPPLNSPPGSEINPANPGSVVERYYSSPASAPLDPGAIAIAIAVEKVENNFEDSEEIEH